MSGTRATSGRSEWTGLPVCVAGIGVSGFAAADALVHLGAQVTVVDRRDGTVEQDKAVILGSYGATVLLGDAAPTAPPPGTKLVVTSPGWPPHAPLLSAAAASGVPIWGEVELAWQLSRAGGRPTPWLVVTGTNGKTTTVRMLASMLSAAGLTATAAGNVGTPLLDVVSHSSRYDVLAVELSSYQLHWSRSVRAHAAAVVNLAPDHLDWHGSVEAYYAAKGRACEGCQVACVYNVADPATEKLAREAAVEKGCRAIGFTLGVPDVGMVGVVDEVLVDRAFSPHGNARQAPRFGGDPDFAKPGTRAVELAPVADVVPYAPHNVANALAAAALARSFGVPPVAVRDGLRGFAPEPHRIATVGRVGGVAYVDDSKATNPHAAAASLSAYDSIVWIAGGQAKGTTFDDLVRGAAPRLRGAVLIGVDRALIAGALARHAPDVPVVDIAATDTEVMECVVGEAGRLAQPGDTVLLAPACASFDMFRDYGERGDRFAAAVARLLAAGRDDDPPAPPHRAQ